MRPADIAELLKSLASDVREFVLQALAPLTAKQAELEARVAAIPVDKAESGPPGASAYEIACAAGFVGSEQAWLASLRGQDGQSVQGERGEDGKSVTVDDIAPLLREEVARQVAEIPRPQDGKSITPEDVRPMLRELVDDAVLAIAPEPLTPEQVREQIGLVVAELPRPADGKSVSVEDVRPMLAELVEKAVAALPVPTDGKDGADGKSVSLDDVLPLVNEACAGLSVPTVDDLQPIVRELVDAAFARLPVPADGKDGTSVTLDELRPLVDEAVAALPPAPAGKSVTVDDVRPLIADLVGAAVAEIPRPADGKDVPIEQVRALVVEAVAQIPKPKDGENVPIEVVAALIAGEVAKAVAALPAAQNGRDAAQIEPLPAIDVTRSYPRGTWAKHAGGLWLARALTDGMAGWDCIVNGVAALELNSDGHRTFEVAALLSDGQRKAAEFAFPAMKYLGAWVAGEYEPGDTTSWDGSMWHCETKTTDKPGSSPAWKLCVKHGRDGKDGVRGPKGERGTEGRNGRDLTQLGFNGQRT